MIEIDLTFSLEGESNDFPSPETLAQGIYDGLPKEWYSYQDDGDYKVIGIVGKDETERRHDNIRLKATVGIRDHQIEVLTAELMQERKLVQHLDGQVVNLIEKNDNQVTIVDAQRTRIHGLIGDADQRNDVITGLRGELFATDKKLKERTESLDVSQHEWKQRGIELIDANQEAQNHAAMIHKIVGAMEEAGYDISGWGNDEQLTELETVAEAIADKAVDMSAMLDNVRTER